MYKICYLFINKKKMKFKTKLNYFIFLIIISLSSLQAQQNQKLRWAFEIFRHGARTPYSGMTSDFEDCFGAKWQGLKELTGVGLRQHFLVGYRNRLKYVNETQLIKGEYDPREVFIISTDSNRTIMSANAQVQGLYPPGTGPTLYDNQTISAVPPIDMNKEMIEERDKLNNDALPNRMNVIPVHSFFNADHFIQLQDKKVCPTTKNYYKKNQEREEVVSFLNNMTIKYGKALKDALVHEEDKKEDVLKDYTKAYYIFDTIISSYTEGVDLPNIGGYSEEELLNDSFKFFEYDLVGNGIDNDKDICLYSMSPIFDRLLKWMNLKIEKDISNDEFYTAYDLPKFVMFSAHDSTCGAFMGFMHEVFKTPIRYPYFATNINLELYRKETGDNIIKKEDYYIEYIINDESIKNISYIEFNETLNKRMKTMEEVNTFCGFNKKEEEQEEDDESVYIWIDVSLGVVSVILVVIIVMTIKKKKNTNKNIENIDSLQPLNEDDK